jgi:hypothetical protein
MDLVVIPEDKKKDYPVPRGYCTFNPPAVFPMPSQTSKIAQMGQPQMQMAPMMMRPVVEANEIMCGRFSPNEETAIALGLVEKVEKECKCAPKPGEEGCPCGPK